MATTLAPKARKKQTLSNTPEAAMQRPTVAIPSFDDLPGSSLVRQSQLVRDPKHPTHPTPLPFSPATLWRKVKAGEIPAPLKLGTAITAWKVSDVRKWLDQAAAEGAQK